jgi:group I intron endonuclease
MIGVYKFTNKISKKIYIGQSIRLEKRIKEHKYESFHLLTKNKYFYSAIRKYGWDNFEWEILIQVTEDSWTKKLLNFYETYFIGYYNSMYNQNGYNVRLPCYYTEYSEETRAKMSNAKKGKPSGRKGIPHINQRGSLHGMYGKHHTKETIQKIKEATKGRIRSKESIAKSRETSLDKGIYRKNSPCKKVICIETGEVFECALDARRKYKIKSSHIGCVCKGKAKTCGGYHWEWA